MLGERVRSREVPVPEPDRQPVGDVALEDALVAACAGAGWAFERLYEHLAPSVVRYLDLHGASDPDSLANDVMLTVFHRLSSFEGDLQGLRSLVFTIAHRRAIDDHRRRSARPKTGPSPSEDHPVGGDVEHEAMEQLGETRIRALVEDLTDDQRAVVLLRIVADLSVDEVAALLGRRPGAIKMLQRRGLARLRRIMEREGVTT